MKDELTELTKKFQRIIDHYMALSDICNKAMACGTMDFDGLLYSEIWKTFDLLIETNDVENNWLEWFIYEADCGKQINRVDIEEKQYIIDSAEQLAKLILNQL